MDFSVEAIDAAVADTANRQIGMHDIYGLLLALQTDVTELKGRTPTVTDHEARIRALEKWVWGAAGLAALAGVVLSQVVSKVLA